MTSNRVVITGRGAVSPFGLGVDTLIDNIWGGRSGVTIIDDWRRIEGLESYLAAPVPNFDVKKKIPRNRRRTMGPMAIYSTVAAQEAIQDSGLDDKLLRSDGTGVVMGSTTGSPSAYEKFYRRFSPNMVIDQIKSGEFFMMMSHTCSANVCQSLGITGEQWSTSGACASSLQAIGLGTLLIRSGRQRIMLCGGSEEVHHTVTSVFDLLRAASHGNENPRSYPRPFDRERDGVVCGGGSGVVVLEDLDSALARGAHIYAEVIGYGNFNDPEHIANPHEHVMIRAMEYALRDAGVAPAEIDYVSAHATATRVGDQVEAAALHRVIGTEVPISSLKGHIGHTLGAAGSLETIILLEMLKQQEIIPTRNLDTIDPECAKINLIKKTTRRKLNVVLKNNFGLGGVNSSLVLRRMSS